MELDQMDEDRPQFLGNENATGQPRHTWRGKLVLLLMAAVVWMIIAVAWFYAVFALIPNNAVPGTYQKTEFVLGLTQLVVMYAPFVVIPYILLMM